MDKSMNIGEAAQAAGVSPKMIRHYERIGLLPAASRTAAGYRQYGEREVSVLRFVRESRRLGFSMEQIAGLLGLWGDGRRASRDVKALAERHLADLDAKMRQMAEMRQALLGLVASCRGDDDPHCAILDELAHPVRPAAAPSRQRPAKAAKARAAPQAAGAAHHDLMAWTQALHPRRPRQGGMAPTRQARP